MQKGKWPDCAVARGRHPGLEAAGCLGHLGQPACKGANPLCSNAWQGEASERTQPPLTLPPSSCWAALAFTSRGPGTSLAMLRINHHGAF